MSDVNYTKIMVDGVQYNVCPEDKIPTDDADLPSYQCEEYRELKADLDLIEAIFEEELDDVSSYLYQWSHEPKKAYETRKKNTLFHNYFGPIVNGFPGFLSKLRNVDTLYESILEHQDNVDLQGNSLNSFMWQTDRMCIRDGMVGLRLDMPRLPRDETGNVIVKTEADRKLLQGVRPYLVLVDRRNILSWDTHIVSGKMVLERVTVRECVYIPNGLFGSTEIYQYRTSFSDGSYVVHILTIDERTNDVQAVIVDAGESSLKEQSLMLYSATDIYPLEAKPPLLNVARKNIAYYQLYSEYRQIIQKLNTPVPVRKGVVMAGSSEPPPPMILGANTGIDVPKDGDFKFESPDGSVLATDEKELANIAQSMYEDSLRFLSGSTTIKTATEALLSSSQAQATMSGIATLKESLLQELNRKWAAYYNVVVDRCNIKVNQDLLKLPLSAPELTSLSKMCSEGQLSIITLLELMAEGLRLPEGIKPAQEVQRIAAQKRKEQKLLMEIQSNAGNNADRTERGSRNNQQNGLRYEDPQNLSSETAGAETNR